MEYKRLAEVTYVGPVNGALNVQNITSQRVFRGRPMGGENRDRVLHEGGVGIAAEPVKEGFAAITANTRLVNLSVSGDEIYAMPRSGVC